MLRELSEIWHVCFAAYPGETKKEGGKKLLLTVLSNATYRGSLVWGGDFPNGAQLTLWFDDDCQIWDLNAQWGCFLVFFPFLFKSTLGGQQTPLESRADKNNLCNKAAGRKSILTSRRGATADNLWWLNTEEEDEDEEEEAVVRYKQTVATSTTALTHLQSLCRGDASPASLITLARSVSLTHSLWPGRRTLHV